MQPALTPTAFHLLLGMLDTTGPSAGQVKVPGDILAGTRSRGLYLLQHGSQ